MCRKFSDEEINEAFELRKQRCLRRVYNRNEYARLLRIFKKRGLIVIAQDRKSYLKRWRQQNSDKIRCWSKRHTQLAKERRKEAKLTSCLNSATTEQLQTAINLKINKNN